MTDFVFRPLVNDPHADVISAQLGTTNGAFSSDDAGQAVKLGAANAYVQCADGDEMEGFVTSVEPFTVNAGKSFGSVQRNKRVIAQVAANEPATVDVGEKVLCGTPISLGTANGKPQVKVGTPTDHVWRCIRILSGTGAAGDDVLIERVNG